MKKSAIVLAVAAALTASASVQAETTFYGRIAAVLMHTDPDAEGADSAWDVQDSGSRWGVKASEDLGNGLSAIARLETAINADRHENARNFDGRLAYVGLKGGFGQLTMGSVWSPYYEALSASDIFNENHWYSYYSGPFRVRNSVRYDTPSMSGFQASVLLNIDNDGAGDAGETGTPIGADHVLTDEDGNVVAVVDNEDGVDQYHIGLTYSGGPVSIGAAYLSNENTDDAQYGVAAKFSFSGVDLAAVYEHVDPDVGAEVDTFYVTGQYTFGANTLKAGYGHNDPDGGDEKDEWGIGITHVMSKTSRVWVEYGDQEDTQSQLTIGLRKDW